MDYVITLLDMMLLADENGSGLTIITAMTLDVFRPNACKFLSTGSAKSNSPENGGKR